MWAALLAPKNGERLLRSGVKFTHASRAASDHARRREAKRAGLRRSVLRQSSTDDARRYTHITSERGRTDGGRTGSALFMSSLSSFFC